MSTSSREVLDKKFTEEILTIKVRELLHCNMISGERDGFNFHFTKPSPDTYPFQFLHYRGREIEVVGSGSVTIVDISCTDIHEKDAGEPF